MKIDKKLAQAALGVFESTKSKELYVNGKGEFFTSENFAMLSDKKALKITKAEMQGITSAADTEKAAAKADADAKKAKAKAEAAAKLGAEVVKKLDGKVGDEAEAALGELKRSELDSLDSLFDADVVGQPNIDAARQVILTEINEKNNGES